MSYFVVLDKATVGMSNTVALDFGRALFGPAGGVIFAVMVSISCFGALNGRYSLHGSQVLVLISYREYLHFCTPHLCCWTRAVPSCNVWSPEQVEANTSQCDSPSSGHHYCVHRLRRRFSVIDQLLRCGVLVVFLPYCTFRCSADVIDLTCFFKRF